MDATPDAAGGSKCPNCGARLIGHWCASCGQESTVEQRALIRTVQRQWRRIRHTLVALMVHPGQLTAEFRDGLRARSISPWRLTFNVLTVFFLLSFATDFGVANFPKEDPSGQLALAISDAAQRARVDQVTFMERVDRRFNPIYTLLLTLSIATSAVVARLTHLQRRHSWGVHFVFALHLTAFGLAVNLVYYLAMRLFGVSVTYSGQTSGVGAVLFAFGVVWQLVYVCLAFRRVYADGWIGASAKAGLIVATGLVVANGLAVLALLLAIKASLHTT